ncbi:FAD/NAD-P-binding domain-containing protein [Fomitopsis serialis]|uniref:FAD/NAD-P-binding domain-containing protein n=1 Tax=Fomitopsis serialis TaxID=139415 RepID=UPI0020077C5B|nr:FAD/NAD-P-binding domain-containing protein [Neoantrodia serialis]KAH9931312.1 FAD/NAD-P-binding domain-containing protein [Neoantrodia serialis]
MATVFDKPALPTLDRLGVSLQADVDVQKVATEWFAKFVPAASAKDTTKIVDLFLEDGWWRDHLALTWELRTFHGAAKIKKFLDDQLAPFDFSGVKLCDGAELKRPYPDLAWVQAIFDFETNVGIGSGVVRLVPTASGEWKAFTLYTTLEELKGFPERIGPNRNFLPNHGKWLSQREEERTFSKGDPASGLDAAARLKMLGVPALVIERQNRIGDQWRYRYEALCLHDPIWYDHLPYLPFPPTWPVFTPAQKLAGWLEYYAEAMELNVWTNAEAENVKLLDDGKYEVVVKKGDGTKRTFTVDHVIMAVGFGGGVPKMPSFPGQEEFQGQILHSTQHKSGRDHIGKKVVIIGACTSGREVRRFYSHDLASDYVEHGVDVTLFQRSETYVMSTKNGMPRVLGETFWEGAGPTELNDRIHTSMPAFMMKEIHKRITKDIAEDDKETLDGLRKVGFKLGWGSDGAGFLYNAMSRGGGYYLDVGTCQKIIDGKIKIKNDSQIERFTKTGLKFENGTELEADVILFATGFEGATRVIKRLVGDEVASRVSPIWALDKEGEQNGAWRFLGVPNLWFMTGM